MAREAVNINDSPETRSALVAALERTPAITDRIYAPGGRSPGGGERQWIAISPDGSRLAIGDAGPAVEVFHAVRQVPTWGVGGGCRNRRPAVRPGGKSPPCLASTRPSVAR